MDEKDEPKSRFESEMTRMMNLVIDKIGGLESKVTGLEKEVAKNSQKLDILTGQFSDVTSMVIGDNKRITKLEGEVAELQSNIH
jgi:peptidoglycan hydrolase CwlO-like protein